jgi:hypothetical protein
MKRLLASALLAIVIPTYACTVMEYAQIKDEIKTYGKPKMMEKYCSDRGEFEINIITARKVAGSPSAKQYLAEASTCREAAEKIGSALGVDPSKTLAQTCPMQDKLLSSYR